MEENRIGEIRYVVVVGLQLFSIIILLSLVCSVHPELPANETVGQWVWLDKAAICILCSLFIALGKCAWKLDFAVSWALILLGGIQAIWGMCQLYGLSASRHSLYVLTGSFFNPGPYSGYLALVLPICLHCWLLEKPKEADWPARVKRTISGIVGLFIVCILPAGMSRSAWLAAGLSCLWIYGMHAAWWQNLKKNSFLYQKKMIVWGGGIILFCVLTIWGLFLLKPASAGGRLFMWKISCHAIAERPLFGYGIGQFQQAYGNAQEVYFSQNGVIPWEEKVAGCPEYAFNEYLQLAVEVGIPLALCICSVIVLCFWIGMRNKRWGVCGAILSLALFSFSSYPMQLPVFVVTLVCLLVACIAGGSRIGWIGITVASAVIGLTCLDTDLSTLQAHQKWMKVRILYNVGAYESAVKEYKILYPQLSRKGSFLFEYGRTLHKLHELDASNRILKRAMQYSNDPMILNVIGKNSQERGDYWAAEDWFMRSSRRLPGRIYPYFLLANLYAESAFFQPDKLKTIADIVLTKEPKVYSTAIKEMRSKVRELLTKIQ